MIGLPGPSFAARVAAAAVLLALVPGSSITSGQTRDRTPPTAPTSLRVTALTSYVVSLAWNPSTDNSGSFSYRIYANGYSGGTVTVGRTSTTFDLRLLSGYKYQIYIYAVDAAGNKSATSNTVTVLLPADTTPPTAPVLSTTGATASTVSLAWDPSADDGPYVSYQVLMNGSPAVWAGGVTSLTAQGLTPSTTYTFSVQGRDNWNNWSPVSNEVTVTTQPSNPNDVTPPTMPGNLTDFGMTYGCEVWLFWTQSTDNEDPQSVLQYEISVNGRLDHVVIGRDRTILYGDVNGTNKFTVVAVDVAGNRSAAASIAFNLVDCQ
jgi:chitodextrinase